MIIQYDPYYRSSPAIESFIERMNELRYRYYASDLLNRLMQMENFDFHMRRAIAMLRLTGIPVQEHIACIYRSDATDIKRDWKLSELAGSLMIISFESSDQEIHELQEALIEYLGI
ncbi:MAG: hypothetical protein ACLFVR_15570 [Thiohalospira sp.]